MTRFPEQLKDRTVGALRKNRAIICPGCLGMPEINPAEIR
jgi:hypothetical protein